MIKSNIGDEHSSPIFIRDKMNNKILIVDDNLKICKLVQQYGTALGFEVDYLINSSEARDHLRTSVFDLVILDVSMPEVDGFELCQMIKYESQVPIIFLSAKVNVDDRIKGLKLGAIDYVVKPFSLEELFLKVKNIIESTNINELIIDDFRFDIINSLVYYKERELKLTIKAYQLLLYIVQNKGSVISREQIMNEVWDVKYFLDTRTIDSHIKEIRKQLLLPLIKTVRGVGYIYENN